jgi:hypothetical protein
MNTNSLFKSSFTIFEQRKKINSMCILSSKVVNNKFQNHNIHESFQSMHINKTIKVCHCYLICQEYHEDLQKNIF